MRTTALLLAYAAALAFGTYHTFRPALDSRFERTQTETGDGMLNHLFLEHPLGPWARGGVRVRGPGPSRSGWCFP